MVSTNLRGTWNGSLISRIDAKAWTIWFKKDNPATMFRAGLACSSPGLLMVSLMLPAKHKWDAQTELIQTELI